MNIGTMIFGGIAASLATFMLAYISMATMVGPWIAPTVVLIASMMLRLFVQRNPERNQSLLALIQAMGATGGVIGMAVGFSFPTLYFLDPAYFNLWLTTPLHFAAVMTAVTLAAGALGMWLGGQFAQRFIDQEVLPFPVSSMVYKTICSAMVMGDAMRLLGMGMLSVAVLCVMRDGIWGIGGLAQKTFYILPALLGTHLPISLFPGPTLWAIGFTSGPIIGLPLLVGVLSKYLVVWPLQHHQQFLGIELFPLLSSEAFLTAFCSGMVVAEVLGGIGQDPRVLYDTVRTWWRSWRGQNSRGDLDNAHDSRSQPIPSGNWYVRAVGTVGGYLAGARVQVTTTARTVLLHHIEAVIALLASIVVLSGFGFSYLAQLVMLPLTAIATYQLCIMGGKVGMLPFGRFATLVMIPTMLVCGLHSSLQITFLCVFVNICSGVAAQLLFNYKIGDLASVSRDRMHRAQWIGLIISGLVIGGALWLLCTNFQLGSAELFAQRGKSRALLVQSLDLNIRILALGALFGFLVKHYKVSPALVLGGLLMPNSVSVGLMIGGFVSWLVPSKEKRTRIAPFWSGIFAGESLWILLRTLGKLCGM